MPKFIELSHVIQDGMITYEELPGPKISDHLSREASRQHYAEGTTFQIGKIKMVANTGTILLGGGIPIVEHLCNFDALSDNEFKFFAVPAPVKGLGSFPVRAFAIID